MTTSHSSETFVLFYPLLFLYQTQLHLAYRRLQGFKRIPFFQKIPHSVKNFIPKNYHFTVKMCTFILFYKNPPSFFSENPPSFLYPKLLYSKFFIHRDIYNYSILYYISVIPFFCEQKNTIFSPPEQSYTICYFCSIFYFLESGRVRSVKLGIGIYF